MLTLRLEHSKASINTYSVKIMTCLDINTTVFNAIYMIDSNTPIIKLLFLYDLFLLMTLLTPNMWASSISQFFQHSNHQTGCPTVQFNFVTNYKELLSRPYNFKDLVPPDCPKYCVPGRAYIFFLSNLAMISYP